MRSLFSRSAAAPRSRTSRGRVLATVVLAVGAAGTVGAAMANADARSGAGASSGAAVPVVATSAIGMRPPSAAATNTHGGQVFRTLDDPADPTFNQLLGINDAGRIVGYFGSGADGAHPNKGFRIRSPYTAFVDENVPGSAQTQVVGINNAGVTVGFSVDAAGANTGFVLQDGRFRPVAHPATDPRKPFNQVLGINDHGVAVGFYNDAAGASHGYTYSLRTRAFRDVSLPVKADSVTAAGIDDNGDVVGFYTVGTTTKAFLLERDGRFRSISLGAGTNTQALGVNDHDQVVGSFVDATGKTHGFVWTDGRARRVDDPKAVGTTVVNGLNNRGQLVGFFTDAAGNTHGFVATGR